MYSIQIGSFVLNGQLILYLSYGAAGWLMLQYRLRHMLERNIILSDVTNAFWLWLIVWKGSFLLFHFVEFIQLPISLLYFDGGERGRWMASLVAVTYMGYRFFKQKLSVKLWIDIGACFTFAGFLVYHVLLLVIGEGPSWFHTVNAGFNAVLLISLLAYQKEVDMRIGLTTAIWFSIGNVLLLFLLTDRSLWLMSFSKQQFIFLLAAACLTGWSWFDLKLQKRGLHE